MTKQNEDLKNIPKGPPPPIKPLVGSARIPRKTKPDYDYWAKLDCWTLQEAACLLCDQSPKHSQMPYDAKKEIREIYQLLQRSLFAGMLEPIDTGYYKAEDILKLAQDKNLNIPLKLADLDKSNAKKSVFPVDRDVDDFIKNLRVSYENKNEIKIQEPTKKAKCFTCEGLGFRDSTTDEWKTLIKILQNAPHTYNIGPSSKTVNGVKTKILSYDAQRQLLIKINKKLVAFLNKQYLEQINSDFKLYELVKDGTSGTYKFKFQIMTDETVIKSRSEKKYENLPKEKLLDHLRSMGTEYSNKPDSDYLKQRIDICLQVLKTTHGMTEEEIMDLINPSDDKEEIVYDPHENLEDSERDY